MTYKFLRSKEDISEFLKRFDYLICDCDGVFWRGNHSFPDVKQTMEWLISEKKKFFFVSNNSTNSRKMYVKKFEKKVGIKIPFDSLYPSSYLLAEYLKSINFKKKAYVLGMEGIRKELDEVGIESCGYGEHFNMPFSEQEFVDTLVIDKEIGAIVGSYDSHFSNYKIAYAHAHYINNPGCLFVATNRDKTFPMVRNDGEKVIIPGGGTYVASLTTCFQHEPFVVGKPSTFGLELILKKYNLNRDKVCYVGDRIDTDILMSNRAKISSLMVLTGISTKEEVDGIDCPEDQKPEYMIERFGDLNISLEKS